MWLRSFARRTLRALTLASPLEVADVAVPPPTAAIVQRVNKYTGLSVPEAEVVAKIGQRGKPARVYEEAGDQVIEFAPRGWHREESFAAPRTAYWKERQARERAGLGDMTDKGDFDAS